jgi:hypothetical protein
MRCGRAGGEDVMKRAAFLPVVLALLAVSCSVSGPALAPTVDEGKVETRVAQDVASTVAALPTSAPPSTGTSPPPSPTLLPSTHTPPPAEPTSTRVPQPTVTPIPTETPGTYVVEDERLIGAYSVALWHNTADGSWSFNDIATISVGGETLVQLESVFGFGDPTGRDITGEGHPDVVLERFTGGAHCCFSVIVYDLGPTLTKVLETRESNCRGRFEDLDGDSVLEFITCDDLFAYVYCPYACSPMVQVIMRYEPGRGYVPASPHFVHLYVEITARHVELAEGATAGELGEWDETTKCAVLPLTLDYLYTGQADRAWAELSRLYTYPDELLFWAEIVQAVSESSLYVSDGSLPPVVLPSYYMLQLLTSCGPDRRYVGLLSEGQVPCDPGVPQRDIYWLESQLHTIGLLAVEERLVLAPDGCAADCRLDVVRSLDDVRAGSIRLDTMVGFPGEVYRVNGDESAHWRLRGDLVWERISP